MNLLRALYCNQYLDLKAQGKEYAANRNGDITATVALLCNFLTIVFALVVLSDSFADAAGDGLESVFGGTGGRTAGRLIALVLMAIIYPIVKYTIGKKENFERTIAALEALPEEEQKAISKRGLIYFFGSIGLVIVSALMLAL